MEALALPEVWFLIAVALAIGFMLGRAGAGSGEDRAQKRMQAEAQAAERYASLPADKQNAIDRLVLDGKLIDAIRLVREETGLGLKEAKDAVDSRKRALKG